MVLSRGLTPCAVIPFRPCQIQLSIKVAEEDKNTMVQAFMARREKIKKELPPTSLDECQETSLPRLNYSIDEEDGWIVIDKPLLYVYAGKGPYVGRFVYQRLLRHPACF